MTILEAVLFLVLVVAVALILHFRRDAKRLEWMSDNRAFIGYKKSWVIWFPDGYDSEGKHVDSVNRNWKAAIDQAIEEDQDVEAQIKPEQ